MELGLLVEPGAAANECTKAAWMARRASYLPVIEGEVPAATLTEIAADATDCVHANWASICDEHICSVDFTAHPIPPYSIIGTNIEDHVEAAVRAVGLQPDSEGWRTPLMTEWMVRSDNLANELRLREPPPHQERGRG